MLSSDILSQFQECAVLNVNSGSITEYKKKRHPPIIECAFM